MNKKLSFQRAKDELLCLMVVAFVFLFFPLYAAYSEDDIAATPNRPGTTESPDPFRRLTAHHF